MGRRRPARGRAVRGRAVLGRMAGAAYAAVRAAAAGRPCSRRDGAAGAPAGQHVAARQIGEVRYGVPDTGDPEGVGEAERAGALAPTVPVVGEPRVPDAGCLGRESPGRAKRSLPQGCGCGRMGHHRAERQGEGQCHRDHQQAGGDTRREPSHGCAPPVPSRRVTYSASHDATIPASRAICAGEGEGRGRGLGGGSRVAAAEGRGAATRERADGGRAAARWRPEGGRGARPGTWPPGARLRHPRQGLGTGLAAARLRSPQTVRMTLPTWLLASTTRWASAASAIGRVRSTTGRT